MLVDPDSAEDLPAGVGLVAGRDRAASKHCERVANVAATVIQLALPESAADVPALVCVLREDGRRGGHQGRSQHSCDDPGCHVHVPLPLLSRAAIAARLPRQTAT
jgi:hypothetical protein